MSYLTGSHSIKAGVFLMYGLTGGHNSYTTRTPGQIGGLPVSYTFSNGDADFADAVRGADVHARSAESGSRPVRAGPVADGTPHGQRRAAFDWVHESVPAISEAAGPLVPARSFAAIDNVPNWKDLNPRFGISWDPFGDGKTAIKGGINRYILSATTGIADFFDPAYASVNSTTRIWSDGTATSCPTACSRRRRPTASAGRWRTRTLARWS